MVRYKTAKAKWYLELWDLLVNLQWYHFITRQGPLRKSQTVAEDPTPPEWPHGTTEAQCAQSCHGKTAPGNTLLCQK